MYSAMFFNMCTMEIYMYIYKRDVNYKIQTDLY